jgi:hypothetical protein
LSAAGWHERESGRNATYTKSKTLPRLIASPDPEDLTVDRQRLERGLPTLDEIIIPVDLSKLILRVFVSPIAKPWFAQLVESLMIRYGRSDKDIHSSLYDAPML